MNVNVAAVLQRVCMPAYIEAIFPSYQVISSKQLESVAAKRCDQPLEPLVLKLPRDSPVPHHR
jgi:hypothetical protein